MTTKYLKYLSAKDWAKVSVPVVFVAVVFFLQGMIVDNLGGLISKRLISTRGVNRVNLDKETQDFAVALAKKNEIPHVLYKDYSNYRNREFIKKQNNDITATRQSGRNDKSANKGEALPPAPQYTLSTVFIGKAKRFAVLNEKVIRIGDTLDSGESVSAIEDGKVLLEGRWGTRWIFVKY
ncbi:MAG: hypothetical protein AB7E76_06115 [Deferribacterales bacterium]